MMLKRLALLGAACLALASPAGASEVFGGLYGHALNRKQPEGGLDILAGVRTDRIQSLPWLLNPSFHLMGAYSTEVDSHFVAAGFNWPFNLGPGGRFYIRPGIGLAVTTGVTGIGNAYEPGLSAAERARRLQLAATRIDYGSSVLFEPELGIGYRFNDRLSVEAAYLHLSNGEIFHRGKNQGQDDLGVRLNYRLGVR